MHFDIMQIMKNSASMHIQIRVSQSVSQWIIVIWIRIQETINPGVIWYAWEEQKYQDYGIESYEMHNVEWRDKKLWKHLIMAYPGFESSIRGYYLQC